ncbi:MAG TPA: crosslink repair DNA glycosylase YcaQ family protein [Vicinamibacterales bacterium]|nr:crosslink repair DNA glycosylase YcaQ family protein [Vicinamibacterales bacterium]
MTIDDLRAFAVGRSLFEPVTLKPAIERLGFVQADPIRAPARAQDLTLRHRVKAYRAGDLEARYATLGIEEDVLVNYGFVSPAVHALMHPRRKPPAPGTLRTRAHRVLTFVRERGEAHPREVDAHFSHGTVTNYWGGSSSATTHLLEELHYRGWLRVTRREGGIRVYARREPAPAGDERSPRERVDRLVDVVVNIYAPLPAMSLTYVVGRLRYAVPQWRRHLKGALAGARARLAHERVDGIDWYWPAGDRPGRHAPDDRVRLLAPFDPVVWDRRRFELLWGWPYRFEAYTPAAKRRFGYYALPMLWRDRVIGWGNLSVVNGRLRPELGYVAASGPRDRGFARELDAELDRVHRFLGLESTTGRPRED